MVLVFGFIMFKSTRQSITHKGEHCAKMCIFHNAESIDVISSVNYHDTESSMYCPPLLIALVCWIELARQQKTDPCPLRNAYLIWCCLVLGLLSYTRRRLSLRHLVIQFKSIISASCMKGGCVFFLMITFCNDIFLPFFRLCRVCSWAFFR